VGDELPDIEGPQLQAAVLVEHPGALTSTSIVSVYAYYSELFPRVPSSKNEKEKKFSLEFPRVDMWNWQRLLDSGVPATFRLAGSDGQDVQIRAGARVPFWTWCGRHAQRCALAIDLTDDREFKADLVQELHLAARKLAAIFSDAGAPINLKRPVAAGAPDEFAREILTRLEPQPTSVWLCLSPHGDDDAQGSAGEPLPAWSTEPALEAGSPWVAPVVGSIRGEELILDPDAQRWGVRVGWDSRSELLRVPLRLGAEDVGVVVASWEAGLGSVDPGEASAVLARAHRVRDVIALWSGSTWGLQKPSPLKVKFRPSERFTNVTAWEPEVRVLSTPSVPSGETDPVHGQ